MVATACRSSRHIRILLLLQGRFFLGRLLFERQECLFGIGDQIGHQNGLVLLEKEQLVNFVAHCGSLLNLLLHFLDLLVFVAFAAKSYQPQQKLDRVKELLPLHVEVEDAPFDGRFNSFDALQHIHLLFRLCSALFLFQKLFGKDVLFPLPHLILNYELPILQTDPVLSIQALNDGYTF